MHCLNGFDCKLPQGVNPSATKGGEFVSDLNVSFKITQK